MPKARNCCREDRHGFTERNLRDRRSIDPLRRAPSHGVKWCLYPSTTTRIRSRTRSEKIRTRCARSSSKTIAAVRWLLERLAEGGFFARPLPQQIAVAR